MPVVLRQRLQAVARDVGNQARVARLLGVSRSQVSRWLRTGRPDAANKRKLEGVEFLLARLLDLYDRPTAIRWLGGLNAHLGNRRPLDLIAAGRIADVLRAVEAEETGSYA